jgi:cytochrome c-type biogenesis protein
LWGAQHWRTSRVLVGTVGFVLGFSAVFVSYGALFGGFGGLLVSHQQLITRVLGVAVIVMGVSFMGLAIPGMGWLAADARWHARPRRGLWGAPLLGVLFGLGWTPCVGPTLAVVQAMAFTQASAVRGAALSMVYCIGLGLPFLLVGVAFQRGLGAIRWVRSHTVVVMRVGGAMLVVIGVLLVTGLWGALVSWLQVRTGAWAVPL